jgi:hypothetical protein
VGIVVFESHFGTVPLLLVKDEAVKFGARAVKSSPRFDPSVVFDSNSGVLSPISGPVTPFSYRQDEDRNIGLLPIADPLPLVSTDGRQVSFSCRGNEQRWGTRTARTAPLVTDCESHVNEEGVEVSNIESGNATLQAIERTSGSSSSPPIWVPATDEVTWEELSSELMDICRQGDVWLEEDDEWGSRSSSELTNIISRDDFCMEEADGWSSGFGSGYETGSDGEDTSNKEKQNLEEQQTAHEEKQNLEEQQTAHEEKQKLEDQQTANEEKQKLEEQQTAYKEKQRLEEQKAVAEKVQQMDYGTADGEGQDLVEQMVLDGQANVRLSICEQLPVANIEGGVQHVERGAAAACTKLQSEAGQTVWYPDQREEPRLEPELLTSSWRSKEADLPRLVIERQMLS